jgi:hypothetical protein
MHGHLRGLGFGPHPPPFSSTQKGLEIAQKSKRRGGGLNPRPLVPFAIVKKPLLLKKIEKKIKINFEVVSHHPPPGRHH